MDSMIEARAGGPDYSLEAALHAQGLRRVAGVDEVGRGPLAGPVIAAAVVLDPARLPAGLDDSKRMTPGPREIACAAIEAAAEVGIGEASVAEIDEMNVLRASHLAMMRALAALSRPPDHVLVDGNLLPRGLEIAATAVVKGDGRSLSIAAASIVAKVARDRIMAALAQQHPGYGWESNAGYPTKCHKSALINLGITPHHRRSFKPVHNILCRDEKISR